MYLPDESRPYVLCLIAARITGLDVDTIYWHRSRAWVTQMIAAGAAASFSPSRTRK